jgi:hypothetical protein
LFNDYMIIAFTPNSQNVNFGWIVWNFWDTLSLVKAYLLTQLKFKKLWIGNLQLQSIKFEVSLD